MSETVKGADPAELQQRIGYRFAHAGTLDQALTHRSVSPDRRVSSTRGYERLEFLGDRVLGLVIADWLFASFPEEPEGALARRFTTLVCGPQLAAVAREIGLGHYLRMAPGEDSIGGRDNDANLADACEALIAALYLDGGMDVARAFVHRFWASAVRQDHKPPREPKTELQEWAQGSGLPLPHYEVVSRSGPDHAPHFVMQVTVQGVEPERAEGSSKRAAEKDAAARLLAKVRTAR